jgi:putative transposase
MCRSCLCATNWYRGGMRCHEHWEPVLPSMIAERQWEQKGFFLRWWQAGLQVYDELEGIQWEWQAVDGAMTKAPLGKSATGANPTDRGKKGTKRSLLTDGAGIPLAMVIDGANRHDVRTAVRDPGWHRHCPFRAAPSSGLSISVWTRAMMGHQHTRRSRLATTSHLFAAVERRNRRKSLPLAIRARRWVGERTHSWINRSRRLLVRSREKRGELPRFPSPCLCSIDLCQNPGFRISSKECRLWLCTDRKKDACVEESHDSCAGREAWTGRA